MVNFHEILDLENKIAMLGWEYQHTPPVFTDYTGAMQHLPDGNTLYR